MDHDPIGVSRDKEDSGIGMKECKLFNQFFSSHLWHHQIGEHEVYLLMGELTGQSHCFIPIGRLQYGVTLITQNFGCQAPQRVIIFHQEYGFVSLWEIACLLLAGEVICFFIHPWQIDLKCRPLIDFTVDPDGTSTLLPNAINHRKPQSCPPSLSLGRKEWIKDLLFDFR